MHGKRISREISGVIKRGDDWGYRRGSDAFVGSDRHAQVQQWARESRRFRLVEGDVGFRFHLSPGCRP